jgi:hypothetical protein
MCVTMRCYHHSPQAVRVWCQLFIILKISNAPVIVLFPLLTFPRHVCMSRCWINSEMDGMWGSVSAIGTLWEHLRRKHFSWIAIALRWWDVWWQAPRVMFTISVSTRMRQFLHTSGRSCGQFKWLRMVSGETSTMVATTQPCLLITTPQRTNILFLTSRMLGFSQKLAQIRLPITTPRPICPVSMAILKVPILRMITPLAISRLHGILSIFKHEILWTTTA